MSYALLGPVGELRPVPAPQSGVGVTAERARNEWQVLGGALVSQQSSRVHRTWAWSFVWKTPALLAWIHELASGVVPGPIWLYTSKAAAENLAPPQLQSGGSGVVANRRVLAASDPEIRSYTFPIPQDKELFVSALGDGIGSATIAIDDPLAYTNPIPNGSFETPGTTVELRRNRFSTWGIANGATLGPTTGPDRKVVVTPGAANAQSGAGYAGSLAVTAGDIYAFSAKLYSPSGGVYAITGTGGFGSTIFTLAAGETRRVSHVGTFTSTGSFGMWVVRQNAGSVDPFTLSEPLLEKNIAVLPYFDPTTPSDGDTVIAWVGTANLSECTMTGTRPSGIANGLTFQSKLWSKYGRYSARIMPAASNDSFGSPGGDVGAFRLGLLPGQQFTAVAWCRLASPLSGSLNPSSRRLVPFYKSSTGNYISIPSSAPPNEAGEYLVRHIFTIPADATEAFIRLYNGASSGNGEVWWDDLTIKPGSHPDLMPMAGPTTAQVTLTPSAGRRAVVTVHSGKGSKLTITPTAGTGMYRITEGPHDGFMIGDGCIPVVVHDPEETLQRAMAGDIKSDFQILVKEVG